MSSKQLRKLEALRAAAATEAAAKEADEENSDESPAPTGTTSASRPGFAAFLVDDTDDEEADSGDCDKDAAITPPVKPPVEVKPPEESSKKKKKNKKRGKTGGAAAAVEPDDDDDTLLNDLAAEAKNRACKEEQPRGDDDKEPRVLRMALADFSAEQERKRLYKDVGIDRRGPGKSAKGPAMKSRGGSDGRPAHNRRLILTELSREENWPHPDGCAEMVPSKDSSGAAIFAIRSTGAHARIRRELSAIHAKHDMEELEWLLHERPACVEALLVVADICRSNGDHEQAFKFIRRAVYAVECNFAPGFSPFLGTGCGKTPRRPRVALDLPEAEDPKWAGWPWLCALFMYMVALQRQGLNRTAIEVCKLLLSATLPRDPCHTLVHLDVLCLAASQFDLLQQFSAELLMDGCGMALGQEVSLSKILPNFAYSVALARQLAIGGSPDLTALNQVTVADVLAGGTDVSDEGSPSVSAHAALMRALLFFPDFVWRILEVVNVNTNAPPPAASPCKKAWKDLWSLKPFTDPKSYQHSGHKQIHALVIDAYARHAVHHWRPEAMLCWVHACAGRLVQMCESSLFQTELCQARSDWMQAPSALDEALGKDYRDLSTSEVGPEWRTPDLLVKALNAEMRDEAEIRRASAELAASFDQPRAAVGWDDLDAMDPEQVAALRAIIRDRMDAADARERRSLVEEQDREYEQSLAVDAARAAGARNGFIPVDLPSTHPPDMPDLVSASSNDEAVGWASESETSGVEYQLDPNALARLMEMGFEEEMATQVLGLTGGNVENAARILADHL